AASRSAPPLHDALPSCYLQTVRYTDEAFGELIQYLKDAGLYEDTMIVIYGDHQGMNMETPSVKSRMSAFLGKEYKFDEMLNVPLDRKSTRLNCSHVSIA